jgi:hypothetical protein
MSRERNTGAVFRLRVATGGMGLGRGEGMS